LRRDCPETLQVMGFYVEDISRGTGGNIDYYRLTDQLSLNRNGFDQIFFKIY